MPRSDPYRVLQVAPDADQVVVKAAYRALALTYHPDRDPSPDAARRMTELNQAYRLVGKAEARAAFDTANRRAAYGFDAGPARSTGSNGSVAAPPPPPRAASAGTRLDFGRYAGWTLRDLVRHDPDYLRWLARHASGLRYRSEIRSILARHGASAA